MRSKRSSKKGITVKKLREDRLKKNRDTAITDDKPPTTGEFIKACNLEQKLFGSSKKFVQGAKKTKPATTKAK